MPQVKRRMKKKPPRVMRWERNKRDARDPAPPSFLPWQPFGKTVEEASVPFDLVRYRNANLLLKNKMFTADDMKSIYILTSQKRVIFEEKKSNIFHPNVALFLMYWSEDDVFREYLRAWRKYRPHVDLSFSNALLNMDGLTPRCDDHGCFGACVQLADDCKLFPPTTAGVVVPEDVQDMRDDNAKRPHDIHFYQIRRQSHYRKHPSRFCPVRHLQIQRSRIVVDD